jgi:hypothetical protein
VGESNTKHKRKGHQEGENEPREHSNYLEDQDGKREFIRKRAPALWRGAGYRTERKDHEEVRRQVQP